MKALFIIIWFIRFISEKKETRKVLLSLNIKHYFLLVNKLSNIILIYDVNTHFHLIKNEVIDIARNISYMKIVTNILLQK